MALSSVTAPLFPRQGAVDYRQSPQAGAPAGIDQGRGSRNNSTVDRYDVGDDLSQPGRLLLGTGAVICAALWFVKKGIPPRFLPAVRWKVPPGQFDRPITLLRTELLTGFRPLGDWNYEVEKLTIGSRGRMLTAEPLADLIAEAPAFQFKYRVRADSIQFRPRADGAVSLSFVDLGGEGGEVVFGVGTPWHRFLVDNQTLWEGRPAGRDQGWLARRLVSLLTDPDSEYFRVLQRRGAVSPKPSVQGLTGHRIVAVDPVPGQNHRGTRLYHMRESDGRGWGWWTEVETDTAFISTPSPDWWKVTFGHRPLHAQGSLNGSILFHKEALPEVIDSFRKAWVELEDGVYQIPSHEFEKLLVALPF